MEATIEGILARYKSLGIHEIRKDIRRHPEKDSGCLVSGVEYLRPFINQYNYALLMFDMEGCGQEHKTRLEIESHLEKKLNDSGWNKRALAIVIEPELDIWCWNDSPHVEEVFGWTERRPNLKDWLRIRGFLKDHQIKPDKPKEALEEALREVRKPRSSSLYQLLAEKVSLQKCTDNSFNKLKMILQKWFTE